MRKALQERMKMEQAVKRILSDTKALMISQPSKFPDVARDHALTFCELPVSLLTSTTLKTLLRFMFRKKKGDKGISKLNTSAAKEMWTNEVCFQTPYSVKQFLVDEKGYHASLVETVLSEQEWTRSQVPVLPAPINPSANPCQGPGSERLAMLADVDGGGMSEGRERPDEDAMMEDVGGDCNGVSL